ncbi:MAG: hypothetical protein RL531_1506 [Actinomycetota bacterium]
MTASIPPPSPTDRMAEGRGIVLVSWWSNLAFALAVLPPVVGVDAFDGVSVGASMISFLVAMVVWTWALVLAGARTTRGDDVQIASLFLVQGAVEGTPRRSLYLSLACCIVITTIAATSDPFAVLAPMLPLGFVGLWGARHGVYPARRDATPVRRPDPPVRTEPADGTHEPDEEG